MKTMNQTQTPMTQKPERRNDPLRRTKGLVLAQLQFHPEGLTHMGLLLKLGSSKETRNLERALGQLSIAGIVQCVVAHGSMVYKQGRK